MPRILIYTLFHFVLAVTGWYMLTEMGRPTEGQALTTFDQIYALIAVFLGWVLTYPSWLIFEFDANNWALHIMLPLQFLTSFLQVNILLFVVAVIQEGQKK